MFTQCPDCRAVYELSTDHLAAAGGMVRCGECGATFNALRRLTEAAPTTASSEPDEHTADKDNTATTTQDSVVEQQSFFESNSDDSVSALGKDGTSKPDVSRSDDGDHAAPETKIGEAVSMAPEAVADDAPSATELTHEHAQPEADESLEPEQVAATSAELSEMGDEDTEQASLEELMAQTGAQQTLAQAAEQVLPPSSEERVRFTSDSDTASNNETNSNADAVKNPDDLFATSLVLDEWDIEEGESDLEALLSTIDEDSDNNSVSEDVDVEEESTASVQTSANSADEHESGSDEQDSDETLDGATDATENDEDIDEDESNKDQHRDTNSPVEASDHTTDDQAVDIEAFDEAAFDELLEDADVVTQHDDDQDASDTTDFEIGDEDIYDQIDDLDEDLDDEPTAERDEETHLAATDETIASDNAVDDDDDITDDLEAESEDEFESSGDEDETAEASESDADHQENDDQTEETAKNHDEIPDLTARGATASSDDDDTFPNTADAALEDNVGSHEEELDTSQTSETETDSDDQATRQDKDPDLAASSETTTSEEIDAKAKSDDDTDQQETTDAQDPVDANQNESQNLLTEDVDGQFEIEDDAQDLRDLGDYLTPRKSLGRRLLEVIALTGLLAVLGGQYVHQHRTELATDPRFGTVVQSLYARAGLTLEANWQVDDYRVARHTVVPRDEDNTVLLARATVINNTIGDRPLPLIRLELRNRWGDAIFGRLFTPEEYLATVPDSGVVAAGARLEVELDLVNPALDQDIGYDFSVCVQRMAGPDCGNASVFKNK